MAKGKVKKGFGSYLAVLLLAIIATFLIIICVMLFSPFKNILGFKYFVYSNDVPIISSVNGEQVEKFDFSSINKININCDYANVEVVRYFKVDDYSIQFERGISGFARENQNTDFSYEIYYADEFKTELNIEVQEPEGFLFFNKSLTIKLLIPTSLDYSLENTELNINNKTGDIYLGNASKAQTIIGEEDKNYISFGTVNVKTEKGNIKIKEFARPDLKNLFVNSRSGKLETDIDINISGNCEIYTEGGAFKFKDLNVAGETKLNLKNGEFYSSNLNADVELNLESGYLDLDKFEGVIEANNAVKQMSSAEINIKDFTGILSVPYANNSVLNLGKVYSDSEVYFHSADGSIKIDEMYGDTLKVETTSGDVSVKTFGEDVDIKTISGDINIDFAGDVIANQIDIITKSGKIDFNVKSDLAFTLEMYYTNGQLRTQDNVSIVWLEELNQNPLKVLGGGNIVKMICDSAINVGFVV